MALFLATVCASTLLQSARAPAHSPAFGLDFIAFYTGGSFVNDGRASQLFDLKAVQTFQRQLAAQNGVKLGDALGPWWNPPFYAWVFAPLARLPFGVATGIWIGINILATGISIWMLRRMLPADCGWRTWSLLAVGVVLSVPFILSITHGQNTGTSLLLVTLTVAAWRGGRGFLAGLVAGLLFYKPQLAAVLAVVMTVSLGWRALLGMAVTGFALLAVTLVTMPGALGEFLFQMPLNVHFVQTDCLYMWERHATFKAFWRLLLQGNGLGEVWPRVTLATALSTAAVGVMLVWISPLRKFISPFSPAPGSDGVARDRLIAATICATPLLMPFYFDYDLLLLAVPATLLAAEWVRGERGRATATIDRCLVVVWPALYAWMLINADVAEQTRVNGAVPLLACVAGLLAARAARVETVAETLKLPHRPLAAAA